jgi:hypothetical protein
MCCATYNLRLTFTRSRLSRDITPALAPCLQVLLDTRTREQPHLSFIGSRPSLLHHSRLCQRSVWCPACCRRILSSPLSPHLHCLSNFAYFQAAWTSLPAAASRPLSHGDGTMLKFMLDVGLARCCSPFATMLVSLQVAEQLRLLHPRHMSLRLQAIIRSCFHGWEGAGIHRHLH